MTQNEEVKALGEDNELQDVAGCSRTDRDRAMDKNDFKATFPCTIYNKDHNIDDEEANRSRGINLYPELGNHTHLVTPALMAMVEVLLIS